MPRILSALVWRSCFAPALLFSVARSLAGGFEPSLQHALQLHAQLQLEPCLGELRRCAAARPDDPYPRFLLAAMLSHYYEKTADAREWARSALALNPGFADACLLLIELEKRSGHLATGEELTRNMQAHGVAVEAGLFVRAPILLELGRRAEARTAYRQALDRQPDVAPAWRDLHRLETEDGEDQAAYRRWHAAAWRLQVTEPDEFRRQDQAYRAAIEAGGVRLAQHLLILGLPQSALAAGRRAAGDAHGPAAVAIAEAAARYHRLTAEFAGFYAGHNRREAQLGRGIRLDWAALCRILRDALGLAGSAAADPRDDRGVALELAAEVCQRFNVAIRISHNAHSCQDGTLAPVAAKITRRLELWDRAAEITAVLVTDPVCNGFDWWYHGGKAGLGGWAEDHIPGTFFLNLPLLEPLPLFLEMSQHRLPRPEVSVAEPRALGYSPGLERELFIKAIGGPPEWAASLTRDAADHTAVRRRLLATGYRLAFVHESLHVLDYAHRREHWNLWEGEYRAKLTVLAYGEEPWIDLYLFHRQASFADDAPPHARANGQLLSDLVACIGAHAERYPSINCRQNILSQLTRLTERQIRGIAREIFLQKFPGGY